jgi:hypothetical protein
MRTGDGPTQRRRRAKESPPPAPVRGRGMDWQRLEAAEQEHIKDYTSGLLTWSVLTERERTFLRRYPWGSQHGR